MATIYTLPTTRRQAGKPAATAGSAPMAPCQSWAEAAMAAFRTGNGPVRINGLWHVRGAA